LDIGFLGFILLELQFLLYFWLPQSYYQIFFKKSDEGTKIQHPKQYCLVPR